MILAMMKSNDIVEMNSAQLTLLGEKVKVEVNVFCLLRLRLLILKSRVVYDAKVLE
jgi:hypothetical protein